VTTNKPQTAERVYLPLLSVLKSFSVSADTKTADFQSSWPQQMGSKKQQLVFYCRWFIRRSFPLIFSCRN